MLKKIKDFLYLHGKVPVMKLFFNSKDYWEKRYAKGGNSGAGSYGRLAEYKAQFVNNLIKENKINSLIEFGCGDGNQLALIEVDNYIGLDISKTIIKTCIDKFKNDHKKSFFLYDSDCFKDNQNLFKASLTISFDVIYHLIEDDVFEKYMRDLFNCSTQYVLIYASNTNDNKDVMGAHVKHRQFTTWIENNLTNWNLQQKTDNPYSFKKDYNNESFADFYLFRKSD